MDEAEYLAGRAIQQWELHDKYRMFPADFEMFHNRKEPDNIVIAKSLIECLRRINLAKIQYMGCGGRLNPSEILNNITAVLCGEVD